MSKNNSFEIDQLPFSKFHIYNWPGVANDDDRSVFVSLLNRNISLSNRFLTSINALCQSNDAIFLCEIKGHLQTGDRPPILINFNNPTVFKCLKHLIVQILSRSCQVLLLLLLQEFIHVIIKTLQNRKQN